MDKISIIDLKIPAKHGVYESEKDKEGLFELDIEMYTDLSIPGNSDQLKETVNYDGTDVFGIGQGDGIYIAGGRK